jgi:hypothetical protein
LKLKIQTHTDDLQDPVFISIEIMKTLINDNRFDIIEKFYKTNIFNDKDYAMASFEGFYINENILGLLTYLTKNKLKSDKIVVKEQTEIFSDTTENVFNYVNNVINGDINTFANKYNLQPSTKIPNTYLYKSNEFIAQTYEYRDLLRDSSYKNNDDNKKWEFLLPNNKFINTLNTYDYNSIFNYNNPKFYKIPFYIFIILHYKIINLLIELCCFNLTKL